MRGLSIPVVGFGGGLGWYDPACGVPYFTTDNEAIGRLAAEHRFDGYDEMTMKNPIKILTLTLPSILGIVSTVVTVLKTLGDWWIPAGALVVLIACLLALLTKVTAKTALSPAAVVPPRYPPTSCDAR